MAEKRNAKAVPVESIVGEGIAPGSIKFYSRDDGVVGLHFVCPCGCGRVGGVEFGPKGWAWNGNRERPSVTPSIYFNRGGQGEWHGYLTDGEFREC